MPASRAPTVRFRFRGKAGRPRGRPARPAPGRGSCAACQELPGQELFQYVDEDGEVRDVASDDVNDYLREVAGGDFTAKDFRTWAGTVLAYRALRALQPDDSPHAAKRVVVEAIKETAQHLGNTPAVARTATSTRPCWRRTSMGRSRAPSSKRPRSRRARRPRLRQRRSGRSLRSCVSASKRTPAAS